MIEAVFGEVGRRGALTGINKNGILAGQVAVITGASRGIGEAIALRYAMEGARVVVSARTEAPDDHYLPGTIHETVAHINEAGGEALAVRADLAVDADRRQLIETAREAFGPVDILVNNAAITYFIPVADFPEKRFRLMMEVQVFAPFQLAQLVLPDMRERGRGWILNVSSGAAIHPDKTAGGARRDGVRHVQSGFGTLHDRACPGNLRRRHRRECHFARIGGNPRRDAPQTHQRADQGQSDPGGAHGGMLLTPGARRPPGTHRADRSRPPRDGGVQPRSRRADLTVYWGQRGHDRVLLFKTL